MIQNRELFKADLLKFYYENIDCMNCAVEDCSVVVEFRREDLEAGKGCRENLERHFDELFSVPTGMSE